MGTERSSGVSRWAVVALFALVLVVAACGGSGEPNGLSGGQVDPGLGGKPTPLAVEPVSPVKATVKPKATAPQKPRGGFYKPSGWDGSSDVDCPDFDTHAHAQSF